ncbi:ethylene-responsive transcription factor ERF017 [Cryptomeria japonica]|uniref:ethylene-responsive transcription factor ERF017 n=1 Tax=Cryptomeria japonica TaxID=3369 RepID=UPI0027DA6084|nr:ethylene-responsive transcription factor ERF017 [Cryptomeria japonica]
MVKSLPKQKPQNSTEKTQPNFKGVRMRKWGKWVSEVRMPNSRARIWLGSYDTPQQAARAYDSAVYCLRGSNAKFNFPDSLPEIPSASSLSPAEIQSVAAKFAVEEFRQPLDYNTTVSGSESQSCVDSEESLEEQNWKLLDSLLEDVESGLPSNLENFLSLEDIDFLLSE